MDRLAEWIRARTLSQLFALTGGGVLLLAAIIIGVVVARIISTSVVYNTGAATALFMDSVISPLAQQLDTEDTLSEGPVRAIEELLDRTPLGARVISVKLWKPDGLVAYARAPELVGRRFPLSENLKSALEGRIVAKLDQLRGTESAKERETGLSLIEIYSPVRKQWSGEIIGVAEFYEDASDLVATLRIARLKVALVVTLAALVIAASLFSIVHKASRTIERQQIDLNRRIRQARAISDQNRDLRLKIEQSVARAVELNERVLRRISADLHDGPAQLIGLASLRLAGIRKAKSSEIAVDNETVVKDALDDAVRQIRLISLGLSLPEIEAAGLAEVFCRVVAAHERYSGKGVEVDLPADLPDDLPPAYKICIYRFVQEGLNNAYRHAGGRGQKVEVRAEGGVLSVDVTNERTAVPPGHEQPPGPQAAGLGLAGLKERIRSLGGEFSFEDAEAGGVVRLHMQIVLPASEAGGTGTKEQEV